jgi:hypothetical protein
MHDDVSEGDDLPELDLGEPEPDRFGYAGSSLAKNEELAEDRVVVDSVLIEASEVKVCNI